MRASRTYGHFLNGITQDRKGPTKGKSIVKGPKSGGEEGPAINRKKPAKKGEE